MKQGTIFTVAILFLLLGPLNNAFAQSTKFTPEEVDDLYSRLSKGSNVTHQEIQALNNSKITVRVKKRTPLYAKRSKSSRVVDYIGPNTNYTWRCFPAKKGSKWARCASDEFLSLE